MEKKINKIADIDKSLDLNDLIKNIENIDADQLKEFTIKSMFLLQVALGKEVVKDTHRMERLRDLSYKLEDSLLKDDNLDYMTIPEKINMLKTINLSHTQSRSFATDYHSSTSQSLEVVSNLTDQLPKQKSKEDYDTDLVKELRLKIAKNVKKRTSDK